MRSFFQTTLMLIGLSFAVRLPGQGQQIDTFRLGNEFVSAGTQAAEMAFLETIDLHTLQVTQLRDSLLEVLAEIQDADLSGEDKQAQQKVIISLLEMYNSMLHTNEMILQGQARIKIAL
jgi:hypothetical protein